MNRREAQRSYYTTVLLLELYTDSIVKGTIWVKFFLSALFNFEKDFFVRINIIVQFRNFWIKKVEQTSAFINFEKFFNTAMATQWPIAVLKLRKATNPMI